MPKLLASLPDLDRVRSHERLMAIWLSTHQHPVRQARVWFPSRPKGYVTATRDIGHYASNRAARLLCLQRKDKTGAKVYKIICDTIYELLPSYAAFNEKVRL